MFITLFEVKWCEMKKIRVILVRYYDFSWIFILNLFFIKNGLLSLIDKNLTKSIAMKTREIRNIPHRAISKKWDFFTFIRCLQNLFSHVSPRTFTCSKQTTETIKRCEICSMLTIKTSEQCRHAGVFIVYFEHTSHLLIVFLCWS